MSVFRSNSLVHSKLLTIVRSFWSIWSSWNCTTPCDLMFPRKYRPSAISHFMAVELNHPLTLNTSFRLHDSKIPSQLCSSKEKLSRRSNHWLNESIHPLSIKSTTVHCLESHIFLQELYSLAQIFIINQSPDSVLVYFHIHFQQGKLHCTQCSHLCFKVV